MYKAYLCLYLYKVLKVINVIYFAQYLRTHSELHNHIARNNSSLIIPRFNLSASQNSFVFQSIKSWNSLPSSIKNSSSIRIFKLKLKKYFCPEFHQMLICKIIKQLNDICVLLKIIFLFRCPNVKRVDVYLGSV